MSRYELVFISSNDDDDKHIRPHRDTVVVKDRTGRLKYASPQDASHIFEDPETGTSFTLIAFMKYSVTFDKESTYENKKVLSLSGYFDLRLPDGALYMLDPTISFQNGRSIQLIGYSYLLSPRNLPTISDEHGDIIFSPKDQDQQ